MTALKIAAIDAPTQPSLQHDGAGTIPSGKKTLAPADDEPLLLNVRGVARVLSTSVTSVWRGVSSGRLPRPVYIMPKTPRWRRGEIESLVAALKPGQRPKTTRPREPAG
jgi:predicted DNA-binding transcriptional regulator AlpA